MLIKTQRELTQISREHEKKHAGQQILCAKCDQFVGYPPAIQIEGSQYYHMKCAMQIVYGVLEALSDYDPATLKQQATMADAFAVADHLAHP